MKVAAKTVGSYLAALPAEQRATLERLRRSILAAVPKATEGISYGVPTVYVDGRMLVSYGAGAKHCSFYPGSVLQLLKVDLKGYGHVEGNNSLSHRRHSTGFARAQDREGAHCPASRESGAAQGALASTSFPATGNRT